MTFETSQLRAQRNMREESLWGLLPHCGNFRRRERESIFETMNASDPGQKWTSRSTRPRGPHTAEPAARCGELRCRDCGLRDGAWIAARRNRGVASKDPPWPGGLLTANSGPGENVTTNSKYLQTEKTLSTGSSRLTQLSCGSEGRSALSLTEVDRAHCH